MYFKTINMKTIILIISYFILSVESEIDFDPITSPLLMIRPCEDESIVIWFDPGLPPREKNRYYVVVDKVMPKGSVLSFSFDSDVYIIRIISHVKAVETEDISDIEEDTIASNGEEDSGESTYEVSDQESDNAMIQERKEEVEKTNVYHEVEPTVVILNAIEEKSIEERKEESEPNNSSNPNNSEEKDYTQYVKEFLSDEEQTVYNFTSDSDGYGFIVKGAIPGISPYLTSLVLNNQEFCNRPKVGYFEEIISETYNSGPYSKCGRNKVEYTELIVNGDATKPGDWPWHVAIYKIKNSALRYICGGTLISKYFILTAAHCVTDRGIAVTPKTLHVVLGKHNLVGEEQESQEKEVHRVIVHKKFQYKILENDIALLKLRSEVVFSNYIQPACLWYSKLKSPNKVFGTVVGWGFDSSDSLTFELRQAKMPIVAKTKCIKSELLFYGKMMNGNKFCAGYHNGTSVCNGDSGSGFHVFIPDEDIKEDDRGAWYLRGIVSVTLSRQDKPICDSTQYAVFTDVEKYRLWIDSYLEIEVD